MIVVSNEPKLIISETNIIYKPKAKKVYNEKQNNSQFNHFTSKTHENRMNNQKHKKRRENWNLNLKRQGNTKSQNFDLISFEEIENDFKKLKARSEIVEVENELLKLLENSTKDTSFDEDERKSKVIERPKNIFYKNYE